MLILFESGTKSLVIGNNSNNIINNFGEKMNPVFSFLKDNLTILFTLIITIASYGQGIIIDHNFAKLNVPVEWIDNAKADLHIAYQHTSHGSQLITGMEGLYNWKGEPYSFNNGGNNAALDLHDYAMSGYGASDLGNPDRTAWAEATYNFLNDPPNADVNVIIWSWCGQVSSADSNDIVTYLDLMTALEDSFPTVKFVYMTGHLDGTGTDGNLNRRNEQIRNFCREHNKTLYDFSDIESYDPDGLFYLDKLANDNCDYDSDNNGTRDKNWAIDWQNSHVENVDWYNCSAAHSQPLNGNLKAYAAWSLWASLAGWDGITDVKNIKERNKSFNLYQNYPNPFNPITKIKYLIPDGVNSKPKFVRLKVYDILGNEIAALVNEEKPAGNYEVSFNAASLTSGIYFYRIEVIAKGEQMDSYSETRKMILLK